MTVDQSSARVGDFARALADLLGRLDRDAGWCAVFLRRDPESVDACLRGRTVPPWDVVAALLGDLATTLGSADVRAEGERLRALHSAALAAHDARPGARAELVEILESTSRERRRAAAREAELRGLLAEAAPMAPTHALRVDLAWARDDHARATARCAELRTRLARLREREEDDAPLAPGPATSLDRNRMSDPASTRTAGARPGRFRGGSRFAGEPDAEAAAPPSVASPEAAPPVPAAAESPPRGARFAGATETPTAATPTTPRPDGRDRREAARIARDLVRLRDQARSGEAHALLVEAARGPAPRLPLIADELGRNGLAADWATLLWEAALLPLARLIPACDALAEAGLADDGARLLRQGAARPAPEVGRGVLGLVEEGRDGEAGRLLDAYLRTRAPEEAARSVAPDPPRLTPMLLRAARRISGRCHRDVAHALRVADPST
ncbi:hypothetical protein [Streptomyces sp. HSG2]|uniref:hypothetical protein n=1 Tax=Streptomyces sp. HSG2 TaxID=2797167 RepID=UPI001905A52B|nr:hypothetical protein [Streptomyces sp. HSG2]